MVKKENRPKYYKKINKNITFLSVFGTLIFWTCILLYIFDQHVVFATLTVAQKSLLTIPYIYAAYWYSIFKDDKVPLEPEWKLCFHHEDIKKMKLNKNIVAVWNWECGNNQQSYNSGSMEEVRRKNTYANEALLLLGILCQLFPKYLNIFDNVITRTFALINIALTLMVLAISRADSYFLYTSYLILPALNIMNMMNLSSLLIVINGFLQGFNKKQII